MANIFMRAHYIYKEYLHKFSWTLGMDRYFPGFNSSERKKKELILEGKYCVWLSNIFAHPGFMREEGSLEILGGSTRAKEMMAPLKTQGQDFQFQYFGTRVWMRLGVYWRNFDWHKSMGKALGGWGLIGYTWSLAKFQRKKFGREKLGRNNSTKIDNPIFGVLQTFPP